MAFKHGKNGYFAITDAGAVERNISPYVSDVSMELKQDNPVTTTFGSTGVKRGVVGLKDGSFTVTGFHDTTATVGSWTVLSALYQTPPATAPVFKWGPEGSTGGLPRITGSARLSGLSMGSPVDGVVPFTATFEADGAFTVDTF